RYFAGAIDQADAQSMLAWLSSDIGVRIRQMEVELSRSKEDLAVTARRGRGILAASPPARTDRMAELVRVTKSAEALAGMSVNTLLGIQRGLLSKTPNPPVSMAALDAQIKTGKPELTRAFFRLLVGASGVIYRTLTDADLD